MREGSVVLGRRLDRYVTSFFLWHFVFCLLAVLGLYVVVETFSRLDDFVEHKGLGAQLYWIGMYHLCQLPVLVSQFLPIVVLLAGIIALARLAYYNELSAMKAAGVSIYRTLVPIFLAALVIGAIGAADQEILLPNIENRVRNTRFAALRTDDQYDDLFVFDDKRHASVWVRRLLNSASGFDLSRIEAAPTRPAEPDAGKPPPSLHCARAVWVDQWVYLFDGATIEPGGKITRFARRTLRTDIPADKFSPPLAPPAHLADATPAHVVTATLDGQPIDIRFAACAPVQGLKVIQGGQITGLYEGENTAAPIAILTALWLDDKWIGRAQTYSQKTPIKRELIIYDGTTLPLDASPQELIKSRADFSLKSFAELSRRAANAHRTPGLRQRLLVDLHSRVAFPFASLVLLLVAIPFLFQQEGGRSTWIGVGLALFVSVCFYFLTYTFQVFGRDPVGIFGGIPWLAAWLPILIFAAAGSALLYNMDT